MTDWEDMPEWQREEARAEALEAAHPNCDYCGKHGCIEKDCPSYTCCGLPPLTTDPEDDAIRVHVGCLDEYRHANDECTCQHTGYHDGPDCYCQHLEGCPERKDRP